MKIGLYFGSFNPVHIGHLIIASHVLNVSHLQKVWFVLSPQNPLKPSTTLLNEYHRLHLVNLAIEGDDRLRASDIEFHLPKPSYTVHTLQYLREKYPDYEFTILMGSDSYTNLDRWKNGDLIRRDWDIMVYQRPGFEASIPPGGRAQVLEAPLLQISATHIRKAIAAGQSIRYLVPEAVEEEIDRSRWYRGGVN